MAPRSYNNARRKESEAQTLDRIVDATISLHARQGAVATSHAQIADLAGVSVATVYKHFPTKEALLPHCIGKVTGQAPAIDADAILAEPDLESRLRLLVEKVFARYRYFHPWIRWTPVDAPTLPAVAEAGNAGAREVEALARSIIAGVGRDLPEERAALVAMIISYPSWQTLEQSLSSPERANDAALLALRLFLSHP
ncbi:TetR/AcrR family transcriptional regulator [Noviherbaspirillum galbum]|uniref:TetR/AcrR family transcriptional regulator n=1 Tax=Noviherbaspirillum galbum TaxID=2709383 RepID=A0A6B3SG22_9BURK|nr:TetR/AcrR family transcriptional regulator [Noviherbaspirillum galbum]NEX59550.1 TetR/AcrR family transcriptional regulator [Noviherbaspirillum galbum]